MGKGRRNERLAKRKSASQANPHVSGIKRRQHSQNGKVPKVSKPPVKGTKSLSKLKVPFGKLDRVLLIGEGDFSFSLSLATHHEVGTIVATSYDDETKLKEKYPQIDTTLQSLLGNKRTSADVTSAQAKAEDDWNGFSEAEDKDDALESKFIKVRCEDVNVLHGIDATSLSRTHRKILTLHAPFTKIVFNFPHTGGLSTDVNRQVRANQELLVNFFNAAKPLLATKTRPAKFTLSTDNGNEIDDDFDAEEAGTDQENNREQDPSAGTILVTLFEGEPYTLWNIRDLARHCGLQVMESFKFPWTAYPGYKHARTVGDIVTGKDRSDEGKRRGAWRGEERDARCYVLGLKSEIGSIVGSKKRKYDGNESDGSE